ALALIVLTGWTPSSHEMAQAARTPPAANEPAEHWDVTKARGATRDIDFTTSESTWMSVDLSPDGKRIVFDLLAHIYRVAAGGGGSAIWMYSRDGGEGVEIVSRDTRGSAWP